LTSSVLKYKETTAERQVGLASITSNPKQWRVHSPGSTT